MHIIYLHTTLVGLYSGGSRWVSGVPTETLFQILKKPFSLQFIFNVHGLSYINYLSIQTILLPDTLIINNMSNLGCGI